MQRQQQAEGQRQAALQAQKASHRHRSRFERALGTPAAETPAAELEGADYDGLPEDGLSQLPDRYLLYPPLRSSQSLSVRPFIHAPAASLLLTFGWLLISAGPLCTSKAEELLATFPDP